MYTKVFCPYCIRVDIIDIPASGNKEKRAEMNQRAFGRNTFPQIFINGEHVGG
ncbi:MAG: glutaredoxin domain-containing protein, partial [Pseudomonadota bacterium]